MSSDLLWALLRKNNSFVVKRNGTEFTAEPGNLTNINSFKYSGLANRKAVSVEPAKDRGIILSMKSKKRSSFRKPAKAFNRFELRRDYRRTARTITNSLRHYRPDLRVAALRRLTRILKSSKYVVPSKPKKLRTKRGTKAKTNAPKNP